MRVMLEIDDWEVNGKIFFVHTYKTRDNSTAVELELEDENGYIHNRVVANHQITIISDPRDTSYV